MRSFDESPDASFRFLGFRVEISAYSHGRIAMLLLIILLVLLFGGGGGYYGYSRWGAGGGLGILGTVLLILLVVYLLGGIHV
jgi:hypothetical protein